MRLFPIRFMVIMLLAPVLLLFVTGASNVILGEVIMPEIKVVNLPKPDTEGTVPLESTMQKRRSVRHYRDSSISIKLISQLLWAAQGITSQQGFRTAPSAGALYPLEIYIIAENVDGLETGIYKYLPADHTLLLTSEGNYSQILSQAALWQEAISQAPAVFVISGVQKKTTGKYGIRGYATCILKLAIRHKIYVYRQRPLTLVQFPLVHLQTMKWPGFCKCKKVKLQFILFP